jgi:hypothetical protein
LASSASKAAGVAAAAPVKSDRMVAVVTKSLLRSHSPSGRCMPGSQSPSPRSRARASPQEDRYEKEDP